MKDQSNEQAGKNQTATQAGKPGAASEGVRKFIGKRFRQLEEKVERDYEVNAELATPWSGAKPGAKAAWDRLAGVTGPRDSERGIRGSI